MRNTLMPTKFGKIRAVAAVVVLAGGLFVGASGPASAQMEDHRQKEGALTVYTAKGSTMQAAITDKAMLDEITRDAPVLADHTMVVMHNGKFFLVNDRKTASGSTIFQQLDMKSMH